jgi:septum formation protein
MSPFILLNNLQIILASASPRRKDLLEQVGFKVLAIPSNISEDEPIGHDFQTHVRDMAIKKAKKIASDYPDSLVLGADTLVICQNQPMGKPKDPEDAFGMLSRLSGTWHQVISGICLMYLSKKLEIVDHAITDVRFYPLTSQEIDDYIQSGEPYDKAGAYAIQGLGARYVQEIRGCFYNVVGLPLGILWQYVKPFPEVTR